MNALPSFQAYQAAFTAYLRNPQQTPAPAGVNKRRMRVYQEIVFNNILGVVSACYPVLSQIVGKRQWSRLIRLFMQRYASDSPLFRDIPAAFLTFLNTDEVINQAMHAAQAEMGFAKPLPGFLRELAHYEWIELALSSRMESTVPVVKAPTNWLSERPIVNPVLENLHYHYPVHTLSPRHKTAAEQPVWLVVYRQRNGVIQFTEINALTAQLLQMAMPGEYTGEVLLQTLIERIQPAKPEAIFTFGVALFQQLYEQEILLGVGQS